MKVRRRDGASAQAGSRPEVGDGDDSVGLVERQRLEDDGADDAEDRGRLRRSDTEREVRIAVSAKDGWRKKSANRVRRLEEVFMAIRTDKRRETLPGIADLQSLVVQPFRAVTRIRLLPRDALHQAFLPAGSFQLLRLESRHPPAFGLPRRQRACRIGFDDQGRFSPVRGQRDPVLVVHKRPCCHDLRLSRFEMDPS